MKRLNRLTLCFSKKLRNLEAAFGMFAAYYNFFLLADTEAGQVRTEARHGRHDGGDRWARLELR